MTVPWTSQLLTTLLAPSSPSTATTNESALLHTPATKHEFVSQASFSTLECPLTCKGHPPDGYAALLPGDIKELHVKVDLIINGKTVLSYSETLCGPGLSKLIFCGKKKGGNLGSTLKCLMATEYSKQDAPAVLLNAPIYCKVMFTSTAC
uniref:Uncharacterized protein n=1 Tax=Pavo cristatus TaxID=9049 RepID=A0A8C9EYT7_PAVCR